MKINLLSSRVILPLTVLVGLGIIGLRVANVWDTVASGKLFVPQAQAQDAPAAKPSPPPVADAPLPAVADTPPGPSLVPPTDSDSSAAEMDVLKQLSDRREQLEKRSRDLDTRESLVKVTEQRVDQKIKEMETLRLQLQSMVNQASEAQQTQLDNLVKIYETMKPEEAAHIFETLDMPVLLSVIQHMKPKSTAPILAKMTPEKAKEVTVALTKQDQLPQIK